MVNAKLIGVFEDGTFVESQIFWGFDKSNAIAGAEFQSIHAGTNLFKTDKSELIPLVNFHHIFPIVEEYIGVRL